MYQVMTDGMVHSMHSTREDANAEIARARKQQNERAEELREQAQGAEDYGTSLVIVTA